VHLWDVLVSIFWFMLLFTWLWLLVTLLGDLFRDHTTGGWGKALWTLFIVGIPWLGALTYIVVRGPSMHERDRADAERRAGAPGRRVPHATSHSSTVDELTELADLQSTGKISQEEFTQAKARVLGVEQPTSLPRVDRNVRPGR
jgi:hypothetical protein